MFTNKLKALKIDIKINILKTKQMVAILFLIVFCFVMDCIIALTNEDTFSDLRKQSNATVKRIWNKRNG